ncbi:[acyl-carrier-protein] S-malonyltransferase [Wolbachia pipientis]|uniref:Malonyl CoA-acyl carrier protein transacylase n=1 Tax=Wolbachia pipientis TaxID=955 RepID=A0A1E7QLK6_WOLPI|nr:ACP S-malonyltransferase [Wolbachia pipientis]OEY87099.1 [acyl-carrier-protein] S-malonyltransferase [Wolbachia pipientis]
MIFVFPGQGSQYVGMGKDLYSKFSVAKQVFDEVDDILNRKLSHVIFNGPIEELTDTENAQPAIMAVSIAVLRVLEHVFGKSLFIDYGVKYICGHSVGEYTALCAAKSLTLESTVKLLQVRSKAMGKASARCNGGMIALLGANLAEVEDILKSLRVSKVCEIANDNSSEQIVVSGVFEALEVLINALKNSSVKRVIKLQVSGPFHSSLMKPADQDVLEFLNNIEMVRPIVPLVSNVTAQAEDNAKNIKKLLAQQIVSKVRWREMVLYMIRHGARRCIEIGPNKVLSNLVKRIDQSMSVKNLESVDTVNEFFYEFSLLTA